MEFKAGQILNFHWGDTFFEKLISLNNKLRYGAGESWTHSGIIGEVLENDLIIYEALNRGFIKSTYSKDFILTKIEDRKIIVGDSIIPLESVKENCDKYLGTDYGWNSIFHIALYYLLGKKVLNYSDGVKSLICSEAVARILYDSSKKEIDFVREFGKSYDVITPQDLRVSKQILWN